MLYKEDYHCEKRTFDLSLNQWERIGAGDSEHLGAEKHADAEGVWSIGKAG